jgi:mono/diheme cytochrome c family protein
LWRKNVKTFNYSNLYNHQCAYGNRFAEFRQRPGRIFGRTNTRPDGHTHSGGSTHSNGNPKDYGVPVEYANVVNPVSADGASLQRGEENYKANCIKCHGEEGRGDGPMAARQNPLPSDYRADHVMELSDGELFYIVTHGMRTWGFFDEETRWDLVNYVRTFQE